MTKQDFSKLYNLLDERTGIFKDQGERLTTHGQMLGEQGDILIKHEKRITALEPNP